MTSITIAPPAERVKPETWFDFFSFTAPLFNFFHTAGQVPSDATAFAARYGTSEDAASVNTLVSAIADIDAIASAFGSPSSLRAALAKDSGILLSGTPPVEAYAHLVWLAGKVHTTADLLSRTLDNLSPLISPSEGDAAARATALDQLFNGKIGLVGTASETALQVGELRRKLHNFPDKLQADVQAVASTPLANTANVEIGALESALPRENRQLADKQKAASGWNPFGRPKQGEVEALEADLAAKQEALAGSQQFVRDLGDFFPQGANALRALPEIDSRLGFLQEALAGVAADLANITRISGKDQLSDIAWLSKALGLPARIAFWAEVSTAAQHFMQHTLVSNS